MKGQPAIGNYGNAADREIPPGIRDLPVTPEPEDTPMPATAHLNPD